MFFICYFIALKITYDHFEPSGNLAFSFFQPAAVKTSAESFRPEPPKTKMSCSDVANAFGYVVYAVAPLTSNIDSD